MSFQSYEPLRSSILSKEKLKELNEPMPWIAVRDTIFSWLMILACWVLVAHYNYWFVVLAVIPIIGTQYYALHIIGHDGLHRRLFRSNKHNDLFANFFIHAPIMAVTRLNRENHMVHHRETSTPDDPDRHKYSHQGKGSGFEYFLFLLGLANLLPTLRNIFAPARAKDNSSASKRRTVGEVILILFWQAVLFLGLTYTIGWWAYPLLWLFPVYVFTFVGDLLRVFCEHSMLINDLDADKTLRLITFTSNPLELAFFAPHNMNLHAAHHLWPSIPYYKLPIANKAIMEYSQAEYFLWRSSYFAYLIEYGRTYTGKANIANL